MDLLSQQNQQKQKSKGQKIVLLLLIVSIILLIISMVAIFLLQSNKTKTLGLNVNGNDYLIQENMLISGKNAKTYISIESVATLSGYDYIEGGYLENKEDAKKCYIENINQVIEYEANNKRIRKIIQGSKIEDEYYDLKNEILFSNNIFYIALEDLNIGCNVVYEFSEEEYKIKINTTENLIEKYNEDKNFTEKGLNVDKNFKNQRALTYNMIVVSNSAGKMGVVDTKTNSIIGYKYTTMEFNECSQKFIVSSDNKYGVISKEGRLIIELKYQEVEIINYYPLLYKVRLNNKYGILNEEGKIIVNLEYDKIGFDESSSLTEAVYIIKDINNKQNGIVVCKNNKYGIAELETGKIILNCEVDKIYSKNTDSEDNKYYIELKGTEIELDRYIEYVNTTTVVTN
ncbi:MAG: WG repeat-containing protein [Clostridia bacterium]|nr:WG repeat-containing protein [Clostridia bacterium]